MTHEIDGETAYPIYSLTVRWEYERDGARRNNMIGKSRMFKEEQAREELEQLAREVFKHNKEARANGEQAVAPYDPALWTPLNGLQIEINGPIYETWCLSWFSHYAFDDGRTDEEFLESFRRYVDRHAHYQPPLGPPGALEERKIEGKTAICLMGAEDLWRWYGSTDDGKDRTDPPCRCKHCKEQGVVRINH